MKKDFKLNYEAVFLLIFSGIMLFMALGPIWEGKIKHDYPHSYLASDSVWRYTWAEDIYDDGKYNPRASFYSGGFKDVIASNPPILYHLVSLLSYFNDVPTYDNIFLVVVIFYITSALILYLIIRKMNKGIAILSLPLSLLVFTGRFYTSLTWGIWDLVTGTVFFAAFFWSMSHIEKKESFIFIGLFLAAMAIAHFPELIFSLGFIAFYFIVKIIIEKKISLSLVKKISFAGIISIIISGYYLIIFKNTWVRGGASQFLLTLKPEDYKGINVIMFSDFGWFLYIIIAGLILSLFLLKKENIMSIFVGYFMIAVGFSNYYGFSHRAFQNRFMWPIYFSVFFGIVIYHAIKLVIKKMNIIPAVVIGIILLIGISSHYYQKQGMNTLLDPYHWEAFNWISKKTPPDSRVFFFYGDIYSQTPTAAQSKRLSHIVLIDDYITKLNNKTITNFYKYSIARESATGFPYMKGFMKFGNYADEKIGEYFERNKTICEFDYLVFDKVARENALVQYNMIIMDSLLKKGNFNKEFENEMIVILRNTKVGSECLG